MPSHRPRSLEFLLGLPTLADNALWQAATRLDAPVLVSANALSVWRRDAQGLRRWCGFNRRNLHLVWRRPVSLDSAGFVATVRYNGLPWSVRQYMDLCAAAPWTWFASADLCVEPKVAADRDTVLDRISGTIRLNRECLTEARRRGIADRFVPVIQGRHPTDCLRCIDRLFDLSSFPLVGVGSMCRRSVEGDDGILRVVDRLDRAFEGSGTRLHLFGLKTTGMTEVHGHPRIASVDSQAFGTAARWNARKGGFSKSNAYLKDVMTGWYREQRRLLAARGFAFRTPVTLLPALPAADPWPILPDLQVRIADAMEELRWLHEDGEIEWSGVSAQRALEWAFLDDLDDELELLDAA